MKCDTRKESSTTQFDVVRIVLSLVTFTEFRVGIVDIKGAYLQSGPIYRKIYVRSPRLWSGARRGTLWDLLKLPYGITEEVHQWATVMEEFLFVDAGMERIFSVGKLFFNRDKMSWVISMLAKITEDLFLSGSADEI